MSDTSGVGSGYSYYTVSGGSGMGSVSGTGSICLAGFVAMAFAADARYKRLFPSLSLSLVPSTYDILLCIKKMVLKDCSLYCPIALGRKYCNVVSQL